MNRLFGSAPLVENLSEKKTLSEQLPTPAIAPPLNFAQQIQQEFLQGSGIAPSLYQVATRLVGDTEVLLGGEVNYPIHEALNWRVTRFGRQARTHLEAILLVNEDGSCWQAKLSCPRLNDKGKPQKYETPVGNGSCAYLPDLPAEIRELISRRYQVEVPLSGSFWDWLEAHPEIPIVPTEGGKKALSLLSHGYVAIALYGVNGGYQRLLDGTRRLIPDMARFAANGRLFVLGFDQDEEETTRRRVNVALSRFSGLLFQSGCPVSIAAWKSSQGKGVDDLIVNCGIAAFEDAYSQALPLAEWRIWQRLQGRLTYKAAIRLNTSDLSTLQIEELPQSGILAIASAKGTGKTKFIASTTQDAKTAVLLGHRICLIRNLCQRLGIHYRGDLDKAQGQYITGSGYTLRVGSCVDSLLALDPQKFAGCDLILDEACQVLRHLLTSATCRKDGMLPALLARFRELVQVAKRVVLADADLDNACLDYIRELRGDKTPLFLIRNDHQPEGYPVRFIQARNASVVTAELLKAIAAQKPGEVIYVATDSKAGSKTLARLVEQCQGWGARILLLNSETSGGEAEREFIANPDAVLGRGDYDVIITSPSMATGVSIEIPNIIKRVFGVFYGVSSTDADIAQTLMRVREAVPRTIWCAERGHNFCKVSDSTNSLEIKGDLKRRTDATARLLRSQLREDVVGELATYNWDSDPHLNLFARISAEQNFSMYNLRAALLARLKLEGHQVTVFDAENDAAAQLLLKQAKADIRQLEVTAIANARLLTSLEASGLESQETISPDDRLALARYHLSDFYGTEDVTVELVDWDDFGRRRSQILELERQLYPDLATERDVRSIEKQSAWGKGIVPWDMSAAELRRYTRKRLGLEQFINPDREWTAEDLKPVADKARQEAIAVKKVLNFRVHDGVSDTQIVHQLLEQMGIRTEFRWQRIDGKKMRVYRLAYEYWQKLEGILSRRRDQRNSLTQWLSKSGSPPPIHNYSIGGDPKENFFITQPEQGNWEKDLTIGCAVNRIGLLGSWLVQSIPSNRASVRQVDG